MKTITFKSIPSNWRKEYLGLKRNTVRTFKEKNDIREEVLNQFIDKIISQVHIDIVNTESNETFTRQVTDVTPFEDMYIISW